MKRIRQARRVAATAGALLALSGAVWAAGGAAAPSPAANCTAQWVATQAFGNVGADTSAYARAGAVAAFYGSFAHVHGSDAGQCSALLG